MRATSLGLAGVLALGLAACGSNDAPHVVRVGFAVNTALDLAVLAAVVTSPPGSSLTQGPEPACRVAPGAGSGTFVETDPGLVTVQLSAPPGTGASFAFQCDFSTRGLPAPDDFSAVTTRALDSLGEPVTPLPQLFVISFEEITPGHGTTTSTFAPDSRDYAITVSVINDPGPLAALQYDLRFLDGNGGWFGRRGSVTCTTHPQVALATYNNRGVGWLSAAMIDLEGFDATGPISTCILRAASEPTVDSFEVTVIDAATPDTSDPSLDPFPEMAVTSIVELFAPNSTTTTFPPNSLDYDVTMSVTNDSGPLSALQFDIRALTGRWLDEAGVFDCRTDVAVGLATYNDRGNGWLSAALIDLTGFDTPVDVLTCRLRSATPPEPASFSLTVVDAATSEISVPPGGRPNPFPTMAVTRIVESDATPGDTLTTGVDGGAPDVSE